MKKFCKGDITYSNSKCICVEKGIYLLILQKRTIIKRIRIQTVKVVGLTDRGTVKVGN